MRPPTAAPERSGAASNVHAVATGLHWEMHPKCSAKAQQSFPRDFNGLDGARGRDRTTDTAIFSRMLYQLSYPGTARHGARERRFIVRPGGCVHPPSPSASAGRARLRLCRQMAGKSRELTISPASLRERSAERFASAIPLPANAILSVHGVVFDILLIGLFVGFRAARDDIGAGQPAVQVDVATALGAERFGGLHRRLAADRALLGSRLAGSGLFRWLSWH